VGAVSGPEDAIGAFNKVRNHFGISRMAQAGAIAALKDQVWLSQVVASVGQSRDQISDAARACGLKPIPSATNFVAIDCGRDGAFAKAVLDGLIARDIFARKPAKPVLDRCIRVSCGPEREMALFAAALAEAVKDAKAT
jgi:histidinol-phosphate aminotransferase